MQRALYSNDTQRRRTFVPEYVRVPIDPSLVRFVIQKTLSDGEYSRLVELGLLNLQNAHRDLALYFSSRRVVTVTR